MKKSAASAFLAIGLLSAPSILHSAGVQKVEPFALDPKAAVAPQKPAPPFQKLIDNLGAKNASQWQQIGEALKQGQPLFTMEQTDGKESIRLASSAFDPGTTIIADFLPLEYLKYIPTYITFSCKTSGEPVDLDVYVMPGKTAETAPFKLTVTAAPGGFQRIVLPLAQYQMKQGLRAQGIGFGVAKANTKSDVFITDIGIGSTPFTADSLKAQRKVINLKGLWRFAPEPANPSQAEKWNTPEFDDSSWQAMTTTQGFSLNGWGWYRQKIIVPKESEGVPLTLVLTEVPYDDQTYFNGTRIGGLTGNYFYNNLILRTYTVPPSLIKYGEANTIAMRTWGTTRGGLGAGLNPKGTYYYAELDPFLPRLRLPGKEEVSSDHFDLSAAQQGMPFEVVFRFPADVMKSGNATLSYSILDFYGGRLATGKSSIAAGSDGLAQAVAPIDSEISKKVYLRGRFKAYLTVFDSAGTPICTDSREFDRFLFDERDKKSLAALPDTYEETSCGKLKLIDEVDCTVPESSDEHPYMQSASSHIQTRNTPGMDLNYAIRDILGKKARELNTQGFFAYRVGRGKLKVHKNYLLRVEYPEDQTRYVPMEIQNGHNFMDIGWKSGVSPDDQYDNWPLSHAWQWHDAIFSLDEETTGRSGAGGASAENGVWVYFMCRKKQGRYSERYQGGPAIGRMKLYEIDVEKNSPRINWPKDGPRRTLMVDWERQADQPPEDIVRYAKLMGYSAVAPIMLKWHFMNYGAPLAGYDTTIIDGLRFWVRKPTAKLDAAGGGGGGAAEEESAEPVEKKEEPQDGEGAGEGGANIAAKTSVHQQYLQATKRYGIDYIPRIEYGGSQALPMSARSIGGDGEIAKPNRFSNWGANLLNPATWDDLARTVDNYFKPYTKDNPQLKGMLWRIRCDRMQISYARADIELFAKETNTKLPENLSSKELAAWISLGEQGENYVEWWHKKRAEFHGKLVSLLRSYRPDLTLYYFNWDADKWGLGLNDFTVSTYFMKVARARYGLVKKVYEKDYAQRKQYTPEDYINMIRTGDIAEIPVWGPDYGLHSDLYRNMKGIQLFAPVSWLYLANCPEYINYFKTGDGVAVSNIVSYDEGAMRSINPKFECNMVIPGGPAFSMAHEVLSWFHADPVTLTYTVYTYGRSFADAHRRFAQAYLALPATSGKIVEQGDKDLRVRTYASASGTYVGVGYKGYTGKKLTIKVPAKSGAKVTNLVTNEIVPSKSEGSDISFELASGPVELNAFLVQ